MQIIWTLRLTRFIDNVSDIEKHCFVENNSTFWDVTVWNGCQKHISKTLEQGYVSHCVVSALLFITFSPLGTTETNCSCEWHFPPRCAWYASRLKFQSQFHDKNVFRDWQHWTPGRPVQHPDSYRVCGWKGLDGKYCSEPKSCICCLVLMVPSWQVSQTVACICAMIVSAPACFSWLRPREAYSVYGIVFA